jgi:heterodisulfide reductase subunit B
MNRRLMLYPGCAVLSRFPRYEAVSVKILAALGLEIYPVQEFCCCGASLTPGVLENWIHLPAYTLAQAERNSLDVITLCGGCTNTFRRAQESLDRDPVLLDRVNRTLERMGLSYTGVARVKHLIDVLDEYLPPDDRWVVGDAGCAVALSPPCQVSRPRRLYENREENWQGMRQIVKRMGIPIVDYPLENECCGATLLTVDRSLAIRAGSSKLRSAMTHGADTLCVACGNCLLLFERYQKRMGLEKHISIVTLAELVGRVMGIDGETGNEARERLRRH